MNVFLTGGSGDLGEALTTRLGARRDTAIRFDVRAPRVLRGVFVEGSILDRGALAGAVRGADCVVHIAAWHGIHERDGSKDVRDFWELNVQGTFEVFEAASRAGVRRVVFISSTSVDKPETVYGQSKILSEQIASGYALRHGMSVVVLRPRAFIPHTNRAMYPTFVDWAKWFMRGAVHVDDVAAAVLLAIDRTAATRDYPPRAYTLDGAYEYTEADLDNWDKDGPGSTFRTRYESDSDLAPRYELPVSKKPNVRKPAETRAAAEELGYRPEYGLQRLLKDLREFGPAGPPAAR